MVIKLKSGPEGVKAVCLVRDKDGKPRFDDIHGIHPALWAMLTEDEKEEIAENGGYPAN